MTKEFEINLSDISSYRKSIGENQATFWKRFGTTQSGGSRYEQGREMPLSTATLIVLHTLNIVSDEDLAMASQIIGNQVGVENAI